MGDLRRSKGARNWVGYIGAKNCITASASGYLAALKGLSHEIDFKNVDEN